MNKYEQNKIKDYQHWTVYVHENQSYLGRCVIACKRAKADDLANASQEELLEFLRIINELKNALQKAFQTDWFNYSFLGNADQHLHCHFIPRYQTERVFEGIVFKDELWGHNYKTDHNFQTTDEIREKIKQTIQKLIEGRPPENWEPSLGRSALC
ncbi:hypothetical protein COU03_03465 [bacterium (Candidatus Gribaldobacteria) CG10_big_fil_rev_8_21_14_0_10_41_12]|uniref:HIT domain-containing protein n=1 Tax=bacterium (Candidatus Gribaldobacteria) CG10_big_fil_rev_8_21_14_0_10_41_12 TaxID=2014277 RepID=A0A2H0UVY9_9BACT|nr:MAG: hypothetical protein COU03_03465 [bacterium (Candidatus Gribaldobacteria) CG10_big_fil_rev_8_21_14_0_10_41_12]